MELQVSEIQTLEPIKFNYDELKKELSEQLEKYKNVVYTEENIKEAKTDRALLNKVSAAINDEKKRIKNLLLEPYAEFETKCKELMTMVDEVSSGIDEQVKNFEKMQSDEKMQQILNYWIENAGEYQELIDVDLIFNERWLNRTYSMSKIETDIKHILEKTKMDLATIDSTITDATINKQVKNYYFNNINNPSVLGLAIQESKKIEEANQKLEKLEDTQNKENITDSMQNIANNEEIKPTDFRVWADTAQLKALSVFLKLNNIKYGPVPNK